MTGKGDITMAGLLIVNAGMDNEQVVGSLCLGSLEYMGKTLPLTALTALQAMGIKLFIVA